MPLHLPAIADGLRFGAAVSSSSADLGQDFARHLRLALPVPHAGIKAAAGEQLDMRAALDDHAVIEHQNLVSANDRRKPVSDDQRGTIARDPVELVLDIPLGVAVERRSRLVEHQDRRTFEDGAGDGDALLFTAG